MSKYSKEYIREQLKSFSPKEIKVFKRLIQEFNYPIDKAFDKIIELKNRNNSAIKPKNSSENETQTKIKASTEMRKLPKEEETQEVITKNAGGQNVIKPVTPEEFELIDIKDEIEPPLYQKRTKELSESEIIPVIDPKNTEIEALTNEQKSIYYQFIDAGRSHENALKEAYKEGKRISSQKLQSLQAFYKFQ